MQLAPSAAPPPLLPLDPLDPLLPLDPLDPLLPLDPLDPLLPLDPLEPGSPLDEPPESEHATSDAIDVRTTTTTETREARR